MEFFKIGKRDVTFIREMRVVFKGVNDIFTAKTNTLHSGLQMNLNLCIFLQTFNAISEWEYVKKEWMCSFFLISMICLIENVSFIYYGSHSSHVSYLLYRVCCLQVLKKL